MEIFFYILLFIFGTLFGSFASVIIHRLKSWEKGIWWGRSHCKDCDRNLSALELIPIFSWVFQWGRCKGCKKQISSIYPILEVTTGLLFMSIGYFLIDSSLVLQGNIIEILRLDFLLFIWFLTIIYVFYDILFLEIPENVLIVGNIAAFWALIASDMWLIHVFPTYSSSGTIDIYAILLCWAIIIGLYMIMIKWMREIYDCLILIWSIIALFLYMKLSGIQVFESDVLSGTIAAVGIFSFFFLQILVSQGRWMWWGDLRIAIFIGLILGVSFAFAGVMLSYFVGSIIGIGMIIVSKYTHGWNTQFNSQIPFGPFLACGCFLCLFFQPQIENLIKIYL